MEGRRKLIVVSNRGPLSYYRENDERVARRGGGGLVTALRSLVSHHEVTWIASAMTDEDRAAADEARGEAIEETARDGSPYRLRFVPHDGHRSRFSSQNAPQVQHSRLRARRSPSPPGGAWKLTTSHLAPSW